MITLKGSVGLFEYVARVVTRSPVFATRCQLRYIRRLRPISKTSLKARPLVEIESSPVSFVLDNGVPPKMDANAGYDYFRRLSVEAKIAVADDRVRKNDEANDDAVSSDRSTVTPAAENLPDIQLLSDLDLSAITPSLPQKSFSLAPYVNDSEVLSNLVKMGVDLSKLELVADVANQLIKMDFNKEVKPLLLFLHRNSVDDNNIGNCITKNPHLLVESLDNMQVRINYLESKKFTREAIARIITKEPHLLTTSTKNVDTQLGYLQKDFMLKGDEVRFIVTKFPKIAIWSKVSIKEVKLILKDFLGFSELELKQLMIADPKIYVSGKHALSKRFDYLHNVVGFKHEDIVRWPRVLRTRTPIIRQRHEFLKFLGRDQFDSTCENYVSPKALVIGRDVEFCDNVAKVPIQQFNDFLKTL